MTLVAFSSLSRVIFVIFWAVVTVYILSATKIKILMGMVHLFEMSLSSLGFKIIMVSISLWSTIICMVQPGMPLMLELLISCVK